MPHNKHLRLDLILRNTEAEAREFVSYEKHVSLSTNEIHSLVAMIRVHRRLL